MAISSRAVTTGCRTATARSHRRKAPAPTRAVGGAARTAAAVLATICLSTTLLPPEAGAVEQAGVVEHAAAAVMGAAATTMTAMAAGLEGWAAGVQHSLRVCDFHCQAVETATLASLGAIFTMVATKWLLVKCGLDSPASPQSDSERMIATAIAAARKAEADDSAQQVASKAQRAAQLSDQLTEEPVAKEAQSSNED